MFRSKVGVNTETLAAGKSLLDNDYAIQILDPNGASRTITVRPQGRGRAFLIENSGTVAGVDLLAVVDKDAAAVITIDAGESAFVVGTGTGLVAIPIVQSSTIDALSITINADAVAANNEDPFYAMLGGDGGTEVIKSRWRQDSSADLMALELFGGAAGATEKSPTVVLGVAGTTTASMDSTLRFEASSDAGVNRPSTIVALGEERRTTITASNNLRLSDGTAYLDLLAGALTESALASMNLSVSGAAVLTGGASMNVGDDVATWTFDGAGAVSETAMTTFSLTPSSTVDIDAGGAVTIDSSAAAISIGGDNVAQALNLATAGARVISMGSAAAASAAIDAGVGALSLLSDVSSTWQLSGNQVGNIVLTLDAINAGAGEGRLALNADDQLNLNDGTCDLQFDAGVVTETAMVSIDITPSGTMTLRGGGVSIFGDDVAGWSFDGAGALTTSGLVSGSLTPSAALTLTVGAASTWSSLDVTAGGATAATAALTIETGDRVKNDADVGVPTSGAVTLRSGTTSQTTLAATGGASGAVGLRSGATDITVAGGTGGASGILTVKSGGTDISAAVAATGGASGAWLGGSGDALSTGVGATSGASGAITLESGSSADAGTGGLTIRSGAPAATGISGNVALSSGSAAGAGTSGNISLTIGSAPGGTTGTIQLAGKVDLTTAGAVTATGNPTWNFGTSQVDFGGNVDITGGLDVDGAALTMTGTNIDLDPTGTFALDMDLAQTVTITLSDNLDGALLIQEAGNSYFEVDTRDAQAVINVGNATTNPQVNLLGTGQVAIAGNVNANAGLDVTGALTLATGAATLTANGASSLTTSAGALTLTGAASSTWQVSGDAAGDIDLTIDANNAGAGASDLVLTAKTQVRLGDAGNPTIDLAGAGAVSASGNPAIGLGTGVLTLGGTSVLSTAALQWTMVDANVAALSFGSAGDLSMLVFDTSEAAEVVIFGAAFGARFNDNIPIRFGTPGTDLVLTPDGTDVVVTATGDLVFADSVDLFIGAGKDLGFMHNGTNTIVDHNTGELIFQIGTRAVTLDPEQGGELKLAWIDSGIVAVNIGGVATAITMNVPSGAVLVCWDFNVTTAIAGIDSTTGTIAMTGGSTLTLGTIAAFAQNTKNQGVLNFTQDNSVTGGVANANFTLSGGVDNTPSAGAIRLKVAYWAVTAQDNA